MSNHYAKAPINEATIDFRVSPPDEITFESLVPFKKNLTKSFPIQEDFTINTAHLVLDKDSASSEFKSQHKGFRLLSEDKRQVLVVTTAGFTFSHMHPYDEWETFRKEARVLWNSYKKACKPSQINRIGIRYINRLDLPLSRLNAYLLLHPTVPPIPNRAALGFFMQLQIPQPDIDGILIINEAKVDAPNPDTLSILLDIDIFREYSWDINHDDEAWDFLEKLRERKNEVFEASITQKTRELIS